MHTACKCETCRSVAGVCTLPRPSGFERLGLDNFHSSAQCVLYLIEQAALSFECPHSPITHVGVEGRTHASIFFCQAMLSSQQSTDLTRTR
jgi:hypothetical protein